MATTAELIAYGAAGLAAAEVAGVTNVTGGGGGGDSGGSGGGFPGLNVELPAGAGAALDGLEAPSLGDIQLPSGPRVQFPDVEYPSIEVPTPSTQGGGDGGNGGSTPVPTGGWGGFDLTDLAGTQPFGIPWLGTGAAAAAETGKAAGDTASGVDKFLQENPYVAAGTGIGAVSPDPITTGLGFAAGSVAEVTADTVTGGTPLGVRSPIDVTAQNWWQGPAPLEGTSAVQGAAGAVERAGETVAASTAVPTAAAGAAASQAADAVESAVPSGPLYKGPDPFGLGPSGGSSSASSDGAQRSEEKKSAAKGNQQKAQVIAEQNRQQSDSRPNEKPADTAAQVREKTRQLIEGRRTRVPTTGETVVV